MTEYVCGFMTYGEAPHLMVALCLKQAPRWQTGFWNGVGGRTGDDGAATVAAEMAREFRQATGVPTEPAEWTVKVSVEEPVTGPLIHFLHCHRASWVGLPEFAAPEPVRWCRVDDLPANVLPDVRWLLPLCLDDRVRFPVRVFLNPQSPTATVAAREEGGGP